MALWDKINTDMSRIMEAQGHRRPRLKFRLQWVFKALVHTSLSFITHGDALIRFSGPFFLFLCICYLYLQKQFCSHLFVFMYKFTLVNKLTKRGLWWPAVLHASTQKWRNQSSLQCGSAMMGQISELWMCVINDSCHIVFKLTWFVSRAVIHSSGWALDLFKRFHSFWNPEFVALVHHPFSYISEKSHFSIEHSSSATALQNHQIASGFFSFPV